jgi:uncharacterized SAM-binding protein YcdF (DUF218 family)
LRLQDITLADANQSRLMMRDLFFCRRKHLSMFFFLSKTVGWILTPTNFIVAVGAIGLACLLTRFGSLGRKLIIASVAMLVVCAFTPFGYWTLVPLEQQFPAWNPTMGPPDGVIVLGGSIAPDISMARRTAVFPYAADRLVAAAELARRFPNIPIIFTGGSATLAVGDGREADFAADIFERLGLPRDRVILERESRNTIENARFTKAIANPKPGQRWLLITSAYHMPRSIGLFRKVGFLVQPYPVDWMTRGNMDLFKFIDRPVDALLRTDIGVREWIGMSANWLAGNSTEFFPRRK